MDFVHDVCYKGLFDLDKSIENGKPEGLKVFRQLEYYICRTLAVSGTCSKKLVQFRSFLFRQCISGCFAGWCIRAM